MIKGQHALYFARITADIEKINEVSSEIENLSQHKEKFAYEKSLLQKIVKLPKGLSDRILHISVIKRGMIVYND